MGRNLVLAVFSLALFLALFEGTLAAFGVSPTLASRDPFVGFAAQIPLYETAPDDPDVLETAAPRRSHFNLQRFERVKPAGTRRIFCLGGSTTYGRPYDDKTSFCGWLRALLPRVDPSQTWEVINAGGISYASYRIANLVDEILRYEPDLLIVYTGHNEFLERRTYPDLLTAQPWLLELRVALNGTRTYSWLSERIANARAETREAREDNTLAGEVEAVLDQSAGLEYYTRSNLQPEAALRHFRFNLERIVASARSARVDVLLVRPASNLRDCSPFKSEHADEVGLAGRNRAASLRSRAVAELEAPRPQAALALLDEAIAIDDRHAETHFLRGRALFALDRPSEARRAFERARDEDVAPLRTPARFADVVSDVARDLAVPLVDFEAIAAASSEGGSPGADLFLDHVHPTIAANGLLAEAVVEAMRSAGWVRAAATPGDEAFQAARAEIEAGVNRRTHGLAQKNLAKVLSWAGKHEEAYRAALRGIEMVGSWHWEVHDVAARAAAQLHMRDAAIEHVAAAVHLAPKNAWERVFLGQLLANAGRPEEAAAEFREAIALRPRLAEAHAGLGRALTELGRAPDALLPLRTAVRVQASAENRAALAAALRATGRGDLARAQLEQAIRADPDSARAALEWSAVYAEEGRPHDAEAWAQRGLALARRSGDLGLTRRAEAALAATRIPASR